MDLVEHLNQSIEARERTECILKNGPERLRRLTHRMVRDDAGLYVRHQDYQAATYYILSVLEKIAHSDQVLTSETPAEVLKRLQCLARTVLAKTGEPNVIDASAALVDGMRKTAGAI